MKMSILQDTHNKQPDRIAEDFHHIVRANSDVARAKDMTSPDVLREVSTGSVGDVNLHTLPEKNTLLSDEGDHGPMPTGDTGDVATRQDSQGNQDASSHEEREHVVIDGDARAAHDHVGRLEQSHSSPVVPDADGTEYTAEYFVPNVHVGRIIGRRGQTISDIQKRSGARIDVPQHSPPGYDMRRISVRGTMEQVDYCLVLIKLLLPLQSDIEIAHLYNDVMRLQDKSDGDLRIVNINVPMIHVGRIIGRKGQYLRQLKEATGATVILPRFSIPGSNSQIFTIMGTADQVSCCEQVLTAKVHECCNSANQVTAPVAPFSDAPMFHQQPREATIVLVPNEHVGRVIGKGGNHIKDLQRVSGAKIYLPGESDDGSTPFRRMRIHGTREQRRQCYQLLVEKVPYLEQATTVTQVMGAPMGMPTYVAPAMGQPPQAEYFEPAGGNDPTMMTQVFSQMNLGGATYDVRSPYVVLPMPYPQGIPVPQVSAYDMAHNVSPAGHGHGTPPQQSVAAHSPVLFGASPSGRHVAFGADAISPPVGFMDVSGFHGVPPGSSPESYVDMSSVHHPYDASTMGALNAAAGSPQ